MFLCFKIFKWYFNLLFGVIGMWNLILLIVMKYMIFVLVILGLNFYKLVKVKNLLFCVMSFMIKMFGKMGLLGKCLLNMFLLKVIFL